MNEQQQAVQDKRLKIKLGSQYGHDLNGHWFYLQPADEFAEAALYKHTGVAAAQPADWVGLTDEQLADCVPEGAQIIERKGERNRVSMTRQQLHEFVTNVAKLREKNGGQS
jgi:hypothetical protein